MVDREKINNSIITLEDDPEFIQNMNEAKNLLDNIEKDEIECEKEKLERKRKKLYKKEEKNKKKYKKLKKKNKEIEKKINYFNENYSNIETKILEIKKSKIQLEEENIKLKLYIEDRDRKIKQLEEENKKLNNNIQQVSKILTNPDNKSDKKIIGLLSDNKSRNKSRNKSNKKIIDLSLNNKSYNIKKDNYLFPSYDIKLEKFKQEKFIELYVHEKIKYSSPSSKTPCPYDKLCSKYLCNYFHEDRPIREIYCTLLGCPFIGMEGKCPNNHDIKFHPSRKCCDSNCNGYRCTFGKNDGIHKSLGK